MIINYPCPMAQRLAEEDRDVRELLQKRSDLLQELEDLVMINKDTIKGMGQLAAHAVHGDK